MEIKEAEHLESHETEIVITPHDLYPDYIELCWKWCWDCNDYISYWTREKKIMEIS